MDVILSRAGLSAVQQRSVCFGAVQDEAKKAGVKLTEAIASVKRLQEVVRVARDVHNAQGSVVTLPSNTEVSVRKMSKTNEDIGPMLREIQSMLNAFTRSSRVHLTEEEDEESDGGIEILSPIWSKKRAMRAAAALPSAALPSHTSGASDPGSSRATTAAPSHFTVRDHHGRPGMSPTGQLAPNDLRRLLSIDTGGLPATTQVVGQKRRATSPPSGNSFLRPGVPVELLFPRKPEQEGIWPRQNQYLLLHGRPRSPVPQSEKRVAQVVDGLEQRLSGLLAREKDSMFAKSVKDALKIAALTRVKGEETRVQESVDSAKVATKELLKRNAISPNSEELLHRLEDLRQILLVVVRAILDTDGKLGASGLRDFMVLIKKLQDAFPPSSSRFKWCTTQLRKHITLKYKRPEHMSSCDRAKLTAFLSEARGWESVNDYSASRFKEIMNFVTEILEGPYEKWEPREDSDVAELIGIVIFRLGAFKDSQVQQGRLFEAHGWLYKMSGRSFSPTLDLTSLPPPQITGVYLTANPGFRSMEDVEDGFNRISKAKATKSFGFLIMTLSTFLATAVMTPNRKLLPLNDLTRFNKNCQALKELNAERERWVILQSYQELEKILYLMRVLMHRRPEYQEASVGTVNVLLALFPPSKRPSFVHTCRSASASVSANEGFALSDD